MSEKKHDKRPVNYDTPSEVALDEASEMSFPNSDPVATSNITRIKKAPEMPHAAEDHQNSHQVKQPKKVGNS
jgi:protease I